MSSQSTSLRDLYTKPSSGWSFTPIVPNGSTSNDTTPLASAEVTYKWTTKPATNSPLDLSPGLDLEPTAPNAKAWAKALIASAVLHYTSAAIAQPWEVGRTLLQVQYIPRSVSAIEDTAASAEEDDVSIISA